MEELGKEQKKVIAKIGLDLNISAQTIAESLGINRSTVYRYADEPTPEDLQQFATEIQQLFYIKQNELLARILHQLSNEVKESYDIKALAFAYGVILKNLNQFESHIKPSKLQTLVDLHNIEIDTAE